MRRVGDPQDARALQRSYYATHAGVYDTNHVGNDEEAEHSIALGAMVGLAEYHGFRSVIDVGAGTGRVLRYLRSRAGRFDRVIGIEPVQEMRAIGHAAGIPTEQLVDGDALHLEFEDNQFDLACAFGVLHHVAEPNKVIHEMFRVARHAVFLSDINTFGAGSKPVRSVKQALYSLKLWPMVQNLVTHGKGYKYSEGDGIFYSYSIYQSLSVIQEYCVSPNLLTTKGFGASPYRSCSHVAMLAVKDPL